MANVFRIILFSPIAWIYGCVLSFRHFLYDSGILSTYVAPVPVVCIGNLELGGSGKTPMADYLIKSFHLKYNIAYLSRGYKRKSTGFRLARPEDQVQDLGDEAFQIYSKWKSSIVLAVDANRKQGIEKILRYHPEINLILLDDAFQHRKVQSRLAILLTPSQCPFFANSLLPAGTLRDLGQSYERAEVVVITKNVQANEECLRGWQLKWNKHNLKEKPLYVSSIRYQTPVNFKGEPLSAGSEVICVAGLASNTLFFTHCESIYQVKKKISKPDHFGYLSDFFTSEHLENKTVLTTEKDFYKLLAIAADKDKLFYVPLGIQVYPEPSFLETIEKGL